MFRQDLVADPIQRGRNLLNCPCAIVSGLRGVVLKGNGVVDIRVDLNGIRLRGVRGRHVRAPDRGLMAILAT